MRLGSVCRVCANDSVAAGWLRVDAAGRRRGGRRSTAASVLDRGCRSDHDRIVDNGRRSATPTTMVVMMVTVARIPRTIARRSIGRRRRGLLDDDDPGGLRRWDVCRLVHDRRRRRRGRRRMPMSHIDPLSINDGPGTTGGNQATEGQKEQQNFLHERSFHGECSKS